MKKGESQHIWEACFVFFLDCYCAQKYLDANLVIAFRQGTHWDSDYKHKVVDSVQ